MYTWALYSFFFFSLIYGSCGFYVYILVIKHYFPHFQSLTIKKKYIKNEENIESFLLSHIPTIEKIDFGVLEFYPKKKCST
jgi:hypothetical protein